MRAAIGDSMKTSHTQSASVPVGGATVRAGDQVIISPGTDFTPIIGATKTVDGNPTFTAPLSSREPSR